MYITITQNTSGKACDVTQKKSLILAKDFLMIENFFCKSADTDMKLFLIIV